MKFRHLVLSLLAVLLAANAQAQQKPAGESEANLPQGGGTIPIPDDGYDGTLASMACVDYIETAAGTVEDVDVSATLEHTWVGDLTVKVVSPAGTIATVMSRPGGNEPSDDGVDGTFGDSSNLALTTAITYSSTNGIVDAELMGSTIDTNGIVCADDGECNFLPNPGSAADSGDLSAIFDDENAAGTWQLCVGDSNGVDTGNLASADFTITAVGGGPALPPAPAVPALSLFGLLALALVLVLGTVLVLRRKA